jgi:hypothetical protein
MPKSRPAKLLSSAQPPTEGIDISPYLEEIEQNWGGKISLGEQESISHILGCYSLSIDPINETTPAKTIAALKKFQQHLIQLTNRAIDVETHNLLFPKINELDFLIAERIKDLGFVKITLSPENRAAQTTVEYLSLFFRKYAPYKDNRNALLNFIATCLDAAKIKYPDLDSHRDRFEKWISASDQAK